MRVQGLNCAVCGGSGVTAVVRIGTPGNRCPVCRPSVRAALTELTRLSEQTAEYVALTERRLAGVTPPIPGLAA